LEGGEQLILQGLQDSEIQILANVIKRAAHIRVAVNRAVAGVVSGKQKDIAGAWRLRSEGYCFVCVAEPGCETCRCVTGDPDKTGNPDSTPGGGYAAV
jgi:hypothetical protein